MSINGNCTHVEAVHRKNSAGKVKMSCSDCTVQTDDFSFADSQGNIVQHIGSEVSHVKQGMSICFITLMRGCRFDSMSQDKRDKFVCIGRCLFQRGNLTAIAQDGNPISHSHDLFQKMRDVNDTAPGLAQVIN